MTRNSLGKERLEKLKKLTNRQIIEFFSRSYKASDGLWFIKAEEKYGFDDRIGQIAIILSELLEV